MWHTHQLGELLLEPRAAPYGLCEAAIEVLSSVKICHLECRMRFERQPRFLRKADEPRIVVVRRRVKRTGEQVLRIVVFEFLVVRQVTEACVEGLRKNEQAADSISILREVSRTLEFLCVIFGMV